MADIAYFGGKEDLSDSDDNQSDSDNSQESQDSDDDISVHSLQSGGAEGDEDEEIDEEKENEDDEDNEEDDENEGDEPQDEGDGEGEEKKTKKTKKVKQLPLNIEYNNEEDDDDNENDLGETYLKKFDKEINQNYIMEFHPECILKNYDEIESLTKVVRDKDGIIVDELHRTIPYLTKYERTRILGQRAKQIDAGATSFVKVPENVIEGYLIAMLELEQKRIPFIIRRPLPNGGSEYWNVKDLENISF